MRACLPLSFCFKLGFIFKKYILDKLYNENYLCSKLKSHSLLSRDDKNTHLNHMSVKGKWVVDFVCVFIFYS